MKTKSIPSILLISILIFCSCIADENEILINKDQQPQLINTLIIPDYDVLQIPNLDNGDTLESSNLIFIGKEF
ncbi:hypothetical protein ACFFU1_14650 [Algibacter miyuki]|uniref:Uncharacterized protein n=1 Tax=Algibacter miyuki TaxID=1306933 RepID=A0ABV5H2L1_9FLAO|nr:hypothetical protein [Algibacter miyuki]MDN3665764.1 hypothetical protein [Algibacter miyuki]